MKISTVETDDLLAGFVMVWTGAVMPRGHTVAWLTVHKSVVDIQDGEHSREEDFDKIPYNPHVSEVGLAAIREECFPCRPCFVNLPIKGASHPSHLLVRVAAMIPVTEMERVGLTSIRADQP